MKAWLITWEWEGDSKAVIDKVVGILNPKWSAKRVGDIVEFLYNECTSTLSEMAEYAKKSTNNPYKSKSDFNGQIHCGHNPYLWSRIVENLQIERDNKTFIETISWKEVPIYEPTDEKPKLIRGHIPKTFIRKITGKISHKTILE